jgi:hypothetical protein
MSQTQQTGPTGPRTAAGKAISSRNAFKHGLASSQLIIEGEDLAEFESLEAALLDEHAPATPTETLLVKDLAKFYWLKDRAMRFQAIAFNITAPHLDKMAAPIDLSVLLRYQIANERAFYKALKTLQVTQKERKQFVSQKRILGDDFVSQSTPEPPQTVKIRPEDLPKLATIDREMVRLAAILKESELTGEDPYEIEKRMSK